MSTSPRAHALLHDAWRVVLFALVYACLAWLGFQLAPAYAHVTSIWFPAGIALAVLLQCGIRLWPGALLGPMCFTLSLGVPLHLALLGGIGDLLSSVVGWWALTRLGFDRNLQTFRDAVLLIVFGAWLPTIFGGGIGAASLILGGVAPPSLFPTIFKVWWLADMAGALTLAPLLLALSSKAPPEDAPGSRREGALLFVLLLATCHQVFGPGSQVFQGNLLTTYLILPFITWAAVRFGILATSAVVMVSSLAAILGCARALAEAGTHRSLQILNLQIFMSVMSGLGLMLSAALAERRKAEQALQRNQRFLNGILDGSPALIYAKDTQGRYLLANRRFLQLFGGSRQTLVGTTDDELFPPEEARTFRASDAQVLATGQVVTTEDRIPSPEGIRIYASIKSPLLDSSGRPEAVCGVDMDITDRLRAEADLRKLRFALEQSPDALFHLDRDGRVQDVNETCCHHLGLHREAILGQPLEALAPSLAGSWESLWKEIQATPALRREGTHRCHDGRSFPMEAVYHAYAFEGEEGCLLFVRDLTQQRSLEEQLRQSQKMEAIGQLAGGIAHDFKNILSAVGLYSSQALEDLGPEDPLRPSLEGIQLAGQKAEALTRQLLAFSRKQVAQPREIHLGGVILEMEPLLKRLIGSTIRFESRMAEGVPTITADPSLLEQVVLNLTVNARDAMPQGGTIRVEVRSETLDAAAVQGHLGALPGRYVLLGVTDTGCGMSPEVKARIFEPFFTTKEPGKGTGLGLATVFGIVQQAGGHLRVESEEGVGTTFRLYFPASSTPALR